MSDLALKDRRYLAGLRRRHRAERRFRLLGAFAICVGTGFLVVLFGAIIGSGANAFRQTVILLDVPFEASESAAGTPASAPVDTRRALIQGIQALFPEVRKRREKRELRRLVSSGAVFALDDLLRDNPEYVGRTVPVRVLASDDVDQLVKTGERRGADAPAFGLSPRQQDWIAALEAEGRLETRFNWTFFVNGDSREPELAGIAVALMGSFFSIVVCLAFAFPLGLMAAIYLEEFAPRNPWTAFIEVNINNLAAVPSIVFGLLGLAVFLNFFNLPRSSPLVGGIVLALMTLPTIIIAGRAALKAVPPSIREAALAVGASPVQAVFHHVVPLAMPGTLTGTIIGTARALGETAPLLMIGMVAFIVDIPESILAPATALPLQVFLWADHPERAFLERTAAATLVLLVFTCAMNLLAVLLRRKFEIRW
ncbi:MAG: phosphate ABC transporter permease PstA [Rhodospirillales bacterium]